MGKYIVGGIILILAIVAGFYLLYPGSKTATPDGGGQPVVTQTIATSTYATTTFSVVYPLNFTVDENYANDSVNPKKPIHGVKFTIPMTMATGTNLSSDTYVAIEQLPNAKNCTGDIYLLDNVKPTSWTDAGVEYSVATTSGAGAGNFYEEAIFARTGSKPCTAVRYFMHSTNIGNYPEGAVREFDKNALLAVFDDIRRSLTFTSAAI